MENLIIQEKGELLVSSVVIAENIDLLHDSVLTTIDKYYSKFIQLGELTNQDFKEALNISNNKSLLKLRRAYLLNENQVTFLFSLSRNTEKVVDFKLALTKAFDLMKKIISKPQSQLDLIMQTAQVMKQIETTQNEHLARIENLEDTKVINTRQRKKIRDLISIKVYALIEFNNLSKETSARKLYSRIHKVIRNCFNIDTYQELPTIRFDDCLVKINNIVIEDLI